MKQKRLKIVPWAHQRECLRAIMATRRRGQDRALFVMASGLGKTYTSAFAFAQFRRHHPKARLLFLAHQNDLLDQARASYQQIFGNQLVYGMFTGNSKETNADAVFATFQCIRQALIGKQGAGRRPFGSRRFEYIVIDESHHGQAPTYRDVIIFFKPTFLLGMTATPDRMDMVDIREIFGKEVYGLDLEEALTRSLLTPVDYRVLADEIVDKGELNVPPHLITVQKLNRIFFVRKRDEEIVQIILDKAKGVADARIVIFDASIGHADALASMMPGAVAIHSSVPYKERERRMEWLRSGIVRVAVTVDQFNEGIDIPEANILVFLRSTQSQRIFRQQLGRGLRKVPGKDRVLVLDFVANCERLVMLDEHRKRLGEFRKVHHRRNRHGEHETFSVDWGRYVFSERAEKIIELLRQAKLPLTNERLLQYLRDYYSQFHVPPRMSDLKSSKGWPAGVTYLRVFGSLLKACELAGIPKGLQTVITDDELIDSLVRFISTNRRVPTSYEFSKENGLFNARTYSRHFGSIGQACRKAFRRLPSGIRGVKPYQERLTDNETLDRLFGFYIQHGRAPFNRDLRPENHMPSSKSIVRRFGFGILDASALAGIPESAFHRKQLRQIKKLKK